MPATVHPFPNFKPNEDAERLRKAMKGLGTDEKVLTEIAGTRTRQQLIEVALAYKTQFGQDLIEDLRSETSGNYRVALLARFTHPITYDAQSLREAIKGLGTDEKELIEILSTRTNEEIKGIRAEYHRLFNRDLEKDIIGDTSGHFRRLLVSLVQGNRDESTQVDIAAATADAEALYKAGEGRWGTDESKFNQILVSRSVAHLRVTFEEYTKIAKHDILVAIAREFSGDIKDGMLAVATSIIHLPTFFAERLYKSMKGLGTDDKTLVRIVVTRADIDMSEIKEAFNTKYGKSLGSFISGDTSGDYEKLLLRLIA